MLIGALFVAAISAILAFLSGMDITRRVVTRRSIVALAVMVTYGIGSAVKALFGISV